MSVQTHVRGSSKGPSRHNCDKNMEIDPIDVSTGAVDAFCI